MPHLTLVGGGYVFLPSLRTLLQIAKSNPPYQPVCPDGSVCLQRLVDRRGKVPARDGVLISASHPQRSLLIPPLTDSHSPFPPKPVICLLVGLSIRGIGFGGILFICFVLVVAIVRCWYLSNMASPSSPASSCDLFSQVFKAEITLQPCTSGRCNEPGSKTHMGLVGSSQPSQPWDGVHSKVPRWRTLNINQSQRIHLGDVHGCSRGPLASGPEETHRIRNLMECKLPS